MTKHVFLVIMLVVLSGCTTVGTILKGVGDGAANASKNSTTCNTLGTTSGDTFSGTSTCN